MLAAKQQHKPHLAEQYFEISKTTALFTTNVIHIHNHLK
jgi:hypothetical protein